MALFGLETFEGLDPATMASLDLASYLTPQYAASPGMGSTSDLSPLGMGRQADAQILEARAMQDYWSSLAEQQAAAASKADDDLFILQALMDNLFAAGESPVYEQPDWASLLNMWTATPERETYYSGSTGGKPPSASELSTVSSSAASSYLAAPPPKPHSLNTAGSYGGIY